MGALSLVTQDNKARGFGRFKGTISSIAATASAVVKFPVNFPVARIRQLRIACSSVDFDVSLLETVGAAADSFEELGNWIDNNLSLLVVNIDEIYQSGSTPPDIYMKIENTDAVNATGTITFEIWFEQMGA